MALAGLVLRPALPADADTLACIEAEAFPDPSWQAADFLHYDCTLAGIEGTTAGFLVSRETFPGDPHTPPEREILNLAVASGFRRSGIGERLLAHEISRGAVLFLEVRQSNVAAIQLYRKMGFTEISERPDYYSQPVESAIVMRLKW